MRTPSSLARRGAALVLAAGLLIGSTACSKDDDKAADKTTTTAAGATDDFCTVEKETRDQDLAERTKKLLESAPEELKADIEAVKKMVDTKADANADAIEKAEAEQDGEAAYKRLTTYLAQNCG